MLWSGLRNLNPPSKKAHGQGPLVLRLGNFLDVTVLFSYISQQPKIFSAITLKIVIVISCLDKVLLSHHSGPRLMKSVCVGAQSHHSYCLGTQSSVSLMLKWRKLLRNHIECAAKYSAARICGILEPGKTGCVSCADKKRTKCWSFPMWWLISRCTAPKTDTFPASFPRGGPERKGNALDVLQDGLTAQPLSVLGHQSCSLYVEH